MIKTAYKFVLFILLLTSFTGCESWMRNPLEDKETGDDIKLLIVDFNFIQTKLAFHLKDIDTDAYIEGSEVELRFVGEDADNLISFTGVKKTSYTTSSGFIEIGVDPNIPISANDPLNISVVVVGDRYVSAPMALSYTTTGTKDILIKLTHIGEKSGSTGAFSEPFDLTFEGVLQSEELVYVADMRTSDTGTDYDYLNLYQNRKAGELVADHLINEPLYSDYGFYYAWVDDILAPPESPSRQSTLNSGTLIYTSILRTGLQKCDAGLTLKITSPTDGGSGSFSYKITYSDQTTKEGIVSGTFPIEILIDNLYYPSSDPAVTVQVYDDSQYTLSSSQQLSNVCGATAEFTATAKTNLKPFKWIIRYSCPDLQASFALSIGGEFKVDGSEDPWTHFKFEEGVATLQLVQDEDYHFRTNIDGEVYEYVLPTDPASLDEFIRNNQSTDFYTIQTLTITEATDLVTVEADVELAGDVCDILN